MSCAHSLFEIVRSWCGLFRGRTFPTVLRPISTSSARFRSRLASCFAEEMEQDGGGYAESRMGGVFLGCDPIKEGPQNQGELLLMSLTTKTRASVDLVQWRDASSQT